MKRQPALNRRAVFAWCMYDFGNSAFTTLVVTFIYATYFTKAIAPDEITGTALWSWGVTITALTVAFLSPLLGALADRGGYRKLFLLLATAICVAGSIMLFKPLPGEITITLVWFVLANIAFEMGGVFYNAFLPDIAPQDHIGRVSGYGWSLGYIGGLLAMFIAMIGFVNPEVPWFGFAKEAGENIRATNLLVAGWFAFFSIPIFLWVKEDKSRISPPEESIYEAAWKQLMETFRHIRKYRQVVRFFIARMIYNDSLVTIFAFGAIYAAGTFDFTIEEIMIFGVALNVAAGIGAFIMGFMDDILGGKRTIQVSLIGLILATVVAALTASRLVFWIAGIVIGLLVGPNQAASRSLMGRFSPPDKKNEFFGFFAFSGKATAFIGPFLFGRFTALFDSQRAGVWIVALLFIIGALLLLTVNEREGMQAARRRE
ncbi:MAG: MFS transporter [Candidatus Neomarinimicrobiota bacterium]